MPARLLAAVPAGLRDAEFGALGSTIYLNAAGYGPLPTRSVAAVQSLNERRAAVSLGFEEFGEGLARTRRACAALIGADESEIALTPNTSVGLNAAADIVRQRADGRRVIVLPDREFPANVYGWMSLASDGFRVERVAVDEHGFPVEDALLERLRRGDLPALAVSAVQFATGYAAHLVRLGAACAEADALFVVDAIQALGAQPLDVRDARIDVLACGGQKWLCGPFGSGFAYVRRDLARSVEPRRPGWLSFESTADFTRLLEYRWDLWDDARRFEVGSLALQDFVALAHSIELILEVGPGTIRQHIAELQEPLLDWTRRSGVDPLLPDERHRSAILPIQVPDAGALNETLARAGVVCVPREGVLRFAPHFYNTIDEMLRVVEILESRGR
jgi:cysteine desulfurase / selenocysteine lyase